MRKLIALFSIIALVAVVNSGCNNMYLEINGPHLPSGVKDVYFTNRDYVNLRVVGDPGDNDWYVRHFNVVIYPGMSQPDRYVPVGPHKYWVQAEVASRGWRSVYPVDVTVEDRPEVGAYCVTILRQDHRVDACQ